MSKLFSSTRFCTLPPWRNRLARSAVNRKVGGSSPPGGAHFFTFSQLRRRVRVFEVNTVMTYHLTLSQFDLRGSVLDFPVACHPLGAWLAQTSMPRLLWQLVSKVGVKGRPFRLQGLKLGGSSWLAADCCCPPFMFIVLQHSDIL